MSLVSSFFLVIAIALAVLIGPQTRDWTWGPAIVALSMSVLASLPVIWRRNGAPHHLGVIALGTIVAGWFALVAVLSPVQELAKMDLLLLASAVASFITICAIQGNTLAERTFTWGIALLLLASVVVMGIQIWHPAFTPVFNDRGVELPSGFYAHYNEGANFVIAVSLLIAAAAFFGKHSRITRTFFGLLAISGFAAAYMTRSRGGIFGLCIGITLFVVIAIIIAKRQNSRWFARAIIALPILATALAVLLFMGWSDAQQLRFGNSDLTLMLDNAIRLYMAGMAISCIGLHPWEGGGSRSYSWESYQFWDNSIQGYGTHKPDLVHNELLQAATDYGLIGAGLLLFLVITIAIIALVRIGTTSPNDKSSCNAWRIGGLAAFFGMFAQSNFSFVFHIIPQAILLGACLGFAAHRYSQNGAGHANSLVSKLIVTGIAFVCVAWLVPYGIKGSKVTLALWPSMFSKTPLTSREARMDGLTAAIQIWPQSQFYQERAGLYTLAAKESGEDWSKTEEIKYAIRDYNTARVLHSYEPSITINQGLLFSGLGRDQEAEEAFEMTIKLQGGMESIYGGNFYYADYLFQKALRTYRRGDPTNAVEQFKLAATTIESGIRLLPERGASLRVAIHESLGAAFEETNDFEGAMKSYEFASTLPSGQTANYRVGALLGRMAAQEWSKRNPSLALAGFIAARNRIGNHPLPSGVSVEQRTAYIAYLDKNIKFLQGANIKPTPSK